MEKKCTSIFGHRYEARYDLGKAEMPHANFKNMDGESMSEVIEKFRTKTYILDICVRCGHIIEKGKN